VGRSGILFTVRSAGIALIIVLLGATMQGRLRPPASLTCDRNKLTAFSGIVTQWSRNDTSARLNMRTDSETRETFNLRFDKTTPLEKWFLLGGEIFRDADWPKIEISSGRLRPEIQATVWVCEGTANPVVDWRLPPQ
jgi:hypothetical protein